MYARLQALSAELSLLSNKESSIPEAIPIPKIEHKSILLKIKSMINKKDSGIKNVKKPPIYKLLQQFPNAFKLLAELSQLGHDKMETSHPNKDHDWQNFMRVEGDYTVFLDAAVRHLVEGNELSNDFEFTTNHITSAAWNLLAALEKCIFEDKLKKK